MTPEQRQRAQLKADEMLAGDKPYIMENVVSRLTFATTPPTIRVCFGF